jgi:hypothetical protein
LFFCFHANWSAWQFWQLFCSMIKSFNIPSWNFLFHVLSNALLKKHPTIWCYITWTDEKALLNKPKNQ